MSFELIALAVVAFGFGAIAVRFIPRDEHGSPRLPRIVDESVGMWVLRRVLGRPTEPRTTASAAPLPQPSADEIAWRIGVPGAAPPRTSSGDVPARPARATGVATADSAPAAPPTPARVMPAAAPERRSPLPPAELVARATAILERQPPPRPKAPPRSALAVQRRVAIVATFLFAAASIAALALSARDLESGVLSATGSPRATATTTPSPFPSGAPAIAASPRP
ncbi:MAG TPA: hypothetical protein VFT20_10685 [Candidatus Limnocylindrales bacterium]|nr:hypothetical protein [Candidatus Limnocylindrales bacterium]